MALRKFDSPREFLHYTEAFLEEREAVHNLPLGLLGRLIKDEDVNKKYENRKAPFMAGSTNGRFCMIQTPPFNLIIAGKEEGVPDAVSWLVNQGIDMPGVTGEKELTFAFIDEWEKQTKKKGKPFMRQRIYKLEKVRDVIRKNGTLTVAKKEDLSLITEWVQLFHKEALTPISKSEAEDFAGKSIEQRTIYLWKNEKDVPVSMAKKARETKNGVSVSLVYTPDQYKREGYATSCVAALSEHLLNEGYSFCCLYTDLDNPVSNSIYTKIGYVPVADSIDYRFGWDN
ncbi:hypothetical protein JSY36_16950 [Bacillus sp. H-16]|uniref:GNAT family N-acetyltransferase n=1 Tax=Alteribacter salitolerans TaxID=2912333 RepID=UPI001965D5C9|nr:hypothetical protein [Alteribacter salitolerans]